jgi:hypothetical protein
MKATVTRLTVHRVCEARTQNEILFVFGLKLEVSVNVGDELELGEPVLTGVLHIHNLTRGETFDAAIKSHDVHDLRIPVKHGGSRTPTIERLHGR